MFSEGKSYVSLLTFLLKRGEDFSSKFLFAVSLIQIPAHAAGIVNASIRGNKDGFDIVQRFNECQTVV